MPIDADGAGYCGRFAPSPSGPLHFGSVVAALGSYLQARSCGGRWLLRIENIDPPREVPGAAALICRDLERLGLYWDGVACVQAERREAHFEALLALQAQGLVYRCLCSRRSIGAGPYAGTCRSLNHATGGSFRIRVPTQTLGLRDQIQGEMLENLADTSGDFVVWRQDDWPAYHLAVVVDDAWMGITEVMRGADLLVSTPRQIFLQQCLGLPTPNYCHLPLALDLDGSKLSKQTHACPVSDQPAGEVIARALRFLGQSLPEEANRESVDTLLRWAIEHWQLARVPAKASTP